MKTRSLVLLVALLLVALAVGLRLRSRDAVPSVEEAGDPTSPASAPPRADLEGRGTRDRGGGDVRRAEHRLDLSAVLVARVIEAGSGRPVAGAKVRGTFGLGWDDGRPSGLEFDQSVVSGVDGVARFEQFPRETSVELHVEAEGFRRAQFGVTLRRSEGEKSIDLALKPGLAPEASSVRVGLPAGVVLEGASVVFADATTKRGDRVPVGGFVPIDDDPAAAVVEHDVAIQLILPGYAGPPERRSFRRGTSLTLAPPGPAVTQEVRLLDELGRGIEGVEVRVWPVESLLGRVRGSAAFGITDADGACRISGHVGTRWEVALDETKVHVIERLYESPLAVGSAVRTIRCLRRVVERLRLDAPGLAASHGSCALDWRSFEPAPGSPIDAMFRAEGLGTAAAIERYRAALPTSVAWARDEAGAPGFSIGLVPGTYVLLPSIEGVVGRETTIQVPVGGGEVLVGFAGTRKVRVAVTGSIDRADGPLPFGAIVAPRRVGWDERVGLSTQIDRLWAHVLAKPPRRDDRDALADFAQFAGRAIAAARSRDPLIGPDLAWSGFDGVAEVDVADEPTELTVLFPGYRVAVVPIEPGTPNLRARVEPSAFRAVEFRVRRTDGRPFAGYELSLDAVDHLRRARPELRERAAVGPDGVLRVGYVPGEVLGLNPWNDAWTLSPAGGATVERIDVGGTPAFLLRTPADGAPTVSIAVEPYVQAK